MWRRPGKAGEPAWSRVAYAYGVVFALGVAYFLVRMPYQISDDLEHLLIFQFQSFREVLVARFTGPESMRPAMWLTQKLLFDVAPGGHLFATYKTFHVAQLLALVALFIRLLRVRTLSDFAVLPLSVAVLVGIHTFNVTVREGYPVNHFMSVLVCCLIVVNLADSRTHWWHDLVVVLTCFYALFTFETGVLVWVCAVTAYAGGWRGVSGKAIVAATLVLAGYFVVRFTILDVGTRTIGAMSSGYGFSTRDTGELDALFGDAPWKFYAYNIASAALTVLFSEPRAGIFQLTHFVIQGDVPVWSVVNVAVSTIGTMFIALAIGRRIGRWWRFAFERDD